MTFRIISSIFLLTFALSVSAQTTEKTFSKSFNTEGKSQIKFDLPGPVDLKVWNQPTIRMEIIVGLPSGNISLVEQLAKVGRYNPESEAIDEVLVITSPNLERVVKVKGEELHENVSYIVFVPKDLEVILRTPPAMATVQEK